MVSDSTASTSSDLGSAIDKIIESTIGPDIMNGRKPCLFIFITLKVVDMVDIVIFEVYLVCKYCVSMPILQDVLQLQAQRTAVQRLHSI